MSRRTKVRLLILLTLAAAAGVWAFGPIQQAQVYHHFCDQRIFWGIPHFGDVASNLVFFVVGGIGLYRVAHQDAVAPFQLIYTVIFAGILLTGAGSVIYHLHPDDANLVYDRLPITLVFMGVTAAVLEEGIGGIGMVALWPLLALGIASIGWWRHTASTGIGDLRLYVLVQYYPMVLIPTVLLLFPGDRVRRGWRPLLFCFGCYGLAKVVESLDCPIFSLTGSISGHSIKHLLSALAVYFLVVRFRAMHADRQPTGISSLSKPRAGGI